MELKIGYYPALDAALALRQLYEFERFSPFSPFMASFREGLKPQERQEVEAIGEGSEGWLSVIGLLLEPGAAGYLGVEEAVLRFAEPEAALPRPASGRLEGLGMVTRVPPADILSRAAGLLRDCLRSTLAPEAARRSRLLLETVEATARGVAAEGPWDFLLGRSDRLFRPEPGSLGFRITPECRLRESEIERLVLCPSLAATRRLSFWRNGGTLLVYLGATVPSAPEDPPDGLLLAALAAGDRTRLRMLRRLAQGPLGNLEMADYLAVNPSTASRHFKVFKDAGFVELREREDGRAEYELRPEAIEASFRAILAFIEGAPPPGAGRKNLQG